VAFAVEPRGDRAARLRRPARRRPTGRLTGWMGDRLDGWPDATRGP
jgi:hypothetical protein